MHPLFGSNRSLMTLFSVWLLVCALITVLLSQLTQTLAPANHGFTLSLLALPWYLLLLFFCFSNYYLCVRLPAQRYSSLHLLVVHGIAGVITVGLWMALGWGWAQVLLEFGLEQATLLYHHTQIGNGLIALLLYGLWVLVHYTYLMAKGDEANNAEVLAQKLLISNIELQTIKATVHPHFMYNSLNMLANLSTIAPEKIHDKCVQMSEFLRYSVNYAKKELVTLEEELNHIKNYLAIESERFGEGLRIETDIDNAILARPAMPLLLFPLIENSIKHGIQSQLDGGFIKIVIKPQGDNTLVCVSNSFDPDGIKPQSTKHGLASLKKRLQSYYGAKSHFKTEQSEQVYSVALTLPPLHHTAALAKGVQS